MKLSRINKALQPSFNLSRLLYSTNNLKQPMDAPVKYSASPASNTTIYENLIFSTSKRKPLIQRISVVASLIAFLGYFCILREENDIDEMLKGNHEHLDNNTKYLQLKLMKQYCKQNKLPVENIDIKLREYEQKLGLSSD